MGKEQCKLTVFFEEPFWVGVFEKIENGKLSVAKVTFGAEPKDYEVYEFVLNHYYDLQFSPAVAAVVKEAKHNPKRMQRDIKRSVAKTGSGTKSRKNKFSRNKSRTSTYPARKGGLSPFGSFQRLAHNFTRPKRTTTDIAAEFKRDIL